MVALIKDEDFVKIADSVKPDSKNRVAIRAAIIQEGVSYHVYRNSLGQIILDPQITIPASEYWLFNNKEALASIQRGLIDSAQGRVSKVDLNKL